MSVIKQVYFDNYNKHKLSLSEYGEKMYFIDMPCNLSVETQNMFKRLLDNNQGVGIIAGVFDEKLTIQMISGLASRILGYIEPKELLERLDTSFLNLLETEEEKKYFYYKLANPDGNLWGYCLNGKDGIPVSIRIYNETKKTTDNKDMWYMSIRRFGEELFDNLTGAYNRLGFIEHLNSLKNSIGRLDDYAILFTNIKGFKAVNDLYGSSIGDNVLRNLYNHFMSSEIDPIACARVESDKFLLLVKKDKLNIDKLPNILKYSFSLGIKTSFVDCVCGIYYIEDDEIDLSVMIDSAKLAKQHIKDAFILPYAVFEQSMRENYISQASTIARFEDALENEEFKVYYQPIIDCKTEKIVSAEALVRWKIKDDTILTPSSFIPALEKNGYIVKLDRYVYREVAADLKERVDNNLKIVPVAVNFSRMDFFDQDRINLLYDRIETDELSRKYIYIEITETSHVTLKKIQYEFIKKVHSLGGRVYVDDFGSANSSFDMLSEYDFAGLKIDMQFITTMVKKKKVRVLIETTIIMAHKLGMKVVAEGVETKEQLDMLREFNCDYVQGYYFSKPLDKKDFDKYINLHI